ncbi:FAD:protein FMN transferase [Bacteroides sp. 519]|uniref:FAD:protein FMN transferase n=1 Tax=Bacteroides sp. 519 TaxID=2302937 RepID=UPI0013D5289F|nr:FAD:protein FMN transferase [Bacteroides sp. 519]NDV59097.1 FAD:protein FMN transferase [Bacteroides sp. 519]
MEEKKKSRLRLLWLIPLTIATVYILYNNNTNIPYQTAYGRIFGTLYKITYQNNKDIQSEIEEELQRFDMSLNPFNTSSIISKLNRNEEVQLDTFFQHVFVRAQEISEATNGAFDGTIAPLANAWGFGFKKGDFPDSLTIDSLLQLTNYKRIALENDKLVKEDPRIMVSYSAIAKGYATDVVAQFLDRKGIKNYMVDIGGEEVLKGVNPHGNLWRVGISKPVEDALAQNQELQMRLQLTDCGIATSGNYRNFYYKDGKKYAHTIDPRTGYPVQHTILSATVIAKDCMSADAYATAFMVMGLEEAETFIASHPEIGACFIYSDEKGEYQTYITENMKKHIIDDIP